MLLGYRRVSTQDQDLTIQTQKLIDAGVSEDKIYGVKASGVSDKNQEELQRLITFAREGDTVVITKLDRLGRSLKQILEVIDTIHRKGATLRCIDQPVDTSKSDPMSKAMLSMMGLFAELERDLIRERTLQGRAAANNYGGRPQQLDDEKRKQIRELLKAGTSKVKLSEKYGVSRTTILRIEKEGLTE
ncbi:MAG: recombinase family protein [Oceanospirillaceae bacterium]|nr:recombinase family protein [Oceanospirillaceae bacterium]